jgi:hypothetical protein
VEAGVAKRGGKGDTRHKPSLDRNV